MVVEEVRLEAVLRPVVEVQPLAVEQLLVRHIISIIMTYTCNRTYHVRVRTNVTKTYDKRYTIKERICKL